MAYSVFMLCNQGNLKWKTTIYKHYRTAGIEQLKLKDHTRYLDKGLHRYTVLSKENNTYSPEPKWGDTGVLCNHAMSKKLT